MLTLYAFVGLYPDAGAFLDTAADKSKHSSV